MPSGYDSGEDSSGSESGIRQHIMSLSSSTPTDAAAAAAKKKKRRNMAPQQTIDSIWSRFSRKRFTKALAVLPFSPVPLPTSPQLANELLGLGFERAAEECRMKVKKIIQECRRLNMRYRDSGWDLDWDFKMEKGNTLNYLGETKFDIRTSRKCNSDANIPKAVRRVHEIFEVPTFMATISGADVKQGYLGDCWIMASLSSLAHVEGAIQRLCVEYDTKIGIYGFVFFRDGEWIYSIIDDKLFLTSPDWDWPSKQRSLLQQIDRDFADAEREYRKTYQTGSKALFFASNKDQNETWLPLIEKAYAKAHGDYASLAGGWMGEGLEDLTGGVTNEFLASDILDTDSFWDNEFSKVNQEFMFGCATGLVDRGYGERNGIREGHAYNVVDARCLRSGQRLVKLRNPWGKIRKGNWEGAWSDGSKEWTMEVQEELGHSFGSDSTFWISYEDMLRKYAHFDRTRLFRDPGWRCCQRWISVDVPWKPEYNEKFHIKLTKDSPLVLVLSQLDGRYFKGLRGPYDYELQFRLHEQDRPSAEEYIVRSHLNYLRQRSVSIEISDMPAGNYSIFVSIAAVRWNDRPSVEEVIQEQCKAREENEKLVQAGYAYDLAHSKAALHMEQLAQIRKKADQKEASSTRIVERRRAWEARHKTRELTKKQKVKNEKKAMAKKMAKAEERAKKEALLAKEREARQAAEAEARKKMDEEEAEKRKQDEESKPKDKAVQTEAELPEIATPGLDKGIQTEKSEEAGDQAKAEPDSAHSSGTSTPQHTPLDTPMDEIPPVLAADNSKEKAVVPPVITAPPVPGGPPPPPPPPPGIPAGMLKVAGLHPPPPPKVKSVPLVDDDSSDSPIDEWEEQYSSDDMTKSLRTTFPREREVDEDSDEPEDPMPWNAICVVGFRVYSKDEDLELRVVMEGGSLSEDGMGQKGAEDIDNAQSNAGGARLEQKDEEATQEKKDDATGKDKEGNEKSEEAKKAGSQEGQESSGTTKDPAALAPYPTIVRKDDEEFEKASAPVNDPNAGKTDGDVDYEGDDEEPTKEAKTPDEKKPENEKKSEDERKSDKEEKSDDQDTADEKDSGGKKTDESADGDRAEDAECDRAKNEDVEKTQNGKEKEDQQDDSSPSESEDKTSPDEDVNANTIDKEATDEDTSLHWG